MMKRENFNKAGPESLLFPLWEFHREESSILMSVLGASVVDPAHPPLLSICEEMEVPLALVK